MNIDKSDFFKEVTLRICSNLDIDRALVEAFEYIRQYIPVDTIGLGYFDFSSGIIKVLAGHAEENARMLWNGNPNEVFLTEQQRQYVALGSKVSPPLLVINRPDSLDQKNNILLSIFPHLVSHSAIFRRMDISDEEAGALLITAEGNDRFQPEHVELIESIQRPFALAMINALRFQELKKIKDHLVDDNRALSADLKSALGFEVVGADFGLKEVMDQVRKIARTNSSTLLLGETGTGKEVIANAIHMASPRHKGPLISLQCGAIPETLLDSELFGHEKGAFTGALSAKRGRFERADGGTLFLDEIGELSPDAQVKLLRVLQERKFERIGGTRSIEVDVRVVAATHRDLEKMVREGSFREDLWYRLNVLPIRIPPLRLRKTDIPSLVQYFTKRKAMEMNLDRIPGVHSSDMKRLQEYHWPGNVRELQNIVERALILSLGEDTLTFPGLDDVSISQETPLQTSVVYKKQTMDEAMAEHIRSTLEQVDWQVAGKGGAAEILDMNPSTLRFRIRKLGIKRGRK